MSTFEMGVAGGAAVAGLIALLWLRSLLARGLRARTARGARKGANGAEAPLIERRVSAVERAQGEIVGRLDDMAETGAPEERMRAMASSLVGLIQDKNAAMETALAGLDQLRVRLGTLEKIGDMAEARALFDGMTERLAAVEAGRKEADAGIEARIAELAGRIEGDGGAAVALGAKLAALHERKDAGLAAMMARLEPLEVRLGRIESGMKTLPAEAAERVDGRVDGIARQQSDIRTELAALSTRAETGVGPFAEISDQLTRLYAQKDSTTEAMLARLAPLEARLALMETGLREADPHAALDRFAERLAASEAAHGAETARLSGEIETLRSAENPFAEISDQLTRLYAQKDSTTEAMLGRLAPLETRLGEVEARLQTQDPHAALDRFAERLAASEAAHGSETARLSGEIETLRSAENPFAEISDQLTRLYAQKDAVAEAVLARLAPVEARLAEMEKDAADRDPRAALDRFAERLAASEAAHGAAEARLSGEIKTLRSAENPFTEISDQLTRLYAQKDSTTEAMLGRLAPLETRLAAFETRMGARDPEAAIAALAERIKRLQGGQGDLAERLAAASAAAAEPVAELARRVADLAARADAAAEAVAARMVPLAERLETLENRDFEDADSARAEAEAIAEQLVAMRAAAEQTSLFADRIAMLETSLPKLTMAQSLMMEALERRAADGQDPAAIPAPSSAPSPALEPEAEPTDVRAAAPQAAQEPADGPAPEADGEIDDIWRIPRVVSMHQG